MAKTLIEIIGVRPAGIAQITKWRYAQVVFDDETETLELVAAGTYPFPNQNCISDYKYNNRPNYPNDGNGPLIKQFCNKDPDNYSLYKFYAQDCKPYVNFTSTPNATECGFGTALPTPGKPSSLPFPRPLYGLWKTYSDCTVKGLRPIEVRFYKKNYTGSVTVIPQGSARPYVLTRDNNRNEIYGIQSTTAEFTFICTENFSFNDFIIRDESDVMVEVDYDGNPDFKGFVIADNYTEPFTSPPYPVIVRATDRLGGLQLVTYPLPAVSISLLRQSVLDVICYCLYMTNLDLDIQTMANLYEAKMNSSPDSDPLQMATISPLVFCDQAGIIDNCYNVLMELCKAWRMMLVQDEGKWKLYRFHEYGPVSLRRRNWSFEGVFIDSEAFYPGKSVASGMITGDYILEEAPTVVEQNGYKRVEVLLDYGDFPTVIINGDYENWDGANFPGWSKVGGVDASRVERTISGTQGVIGLANYALQFNQLATSSKFVRALPIPVRLGDSIAFKVLVGPSLPLNTQLMVRFQVGSWTLTNDPNMMNGQQSELSWKQGVYNAYFLILKNPQNPVITTISLPEIPTTGKLVISINGFNNATGIWIDNLGISKGGDTNKYSSTGSLAISEQLGDFRNKPEMLVIKIGDFDPTTEILSLPPTQPQTPTTTEISKNGYAIYTSDGSYSKKWNEVGVGGAGVPFVMANARAGLRVSALPYAILQSASIAGPYLNATDFYSIPLDCAPEFALKGFLPTGGSWDRKQEVFDGNLREIGTRNIISNDVTVPYLPNQFSVDVVTDPRGLQDRSGVFSEEFTVEFI